MISSPARGSETGLGKSKDDLNPPTTAAFSPTSGTSSPATRQRSTILVHRKSPMLVATPPTITRALSFSHPFLLPLNQIVGLITWTSGDPWESFLVVAGFWAITIYGDMVIRYAGPLMVVISVILGMYSRRYSPLSSRGWTGEKLKDPKEKSEGNMKHQKSLDEIVETLTVFTSRCNILLEPFVQLTDFLSTQRTATSATTRPALTTLSIRMLYISPIWIGLTLPPLYILTTRRVILAVGTVMLSWHSRPARVTRTLLWRSRLIRRVVSVTTGLTFGNQPGTPVAPRKGVPPPLPPRHQSQHDVANSLAAHGHAEASGVRFTFVVFENQRRWLGLGWTYSLLAYERTAWTDEHLNSSDPKDSFVLPHVDNETARWRWVPGSEWQVEGGGKNRASTGADGWIYYDNKVSQSQDAWQIATDRHSGMMAVVVKTAGDDIPDVGSGIEMLSWWRRAEALGSMGPRIPWFHLLLVLLPWTPRQTIHKLRKTVMQVAAKLEDVASLGRIVGQAHIAAATPQDRPLYEVMSVTLSNYPHIKSGTDIGALETTQRWAWSENGGTRQMIT